MLIRLQYDKPVINPSTYQGSVVVEFTRYKNWGEELDRGMRLIDYEEELGGRYLFRVSLHAPTIYRIPTTCQSEIATRSDKYTVTLMRGVGHESWAVEIGQDRTLVVIELDHFDQGFFIPMKAGTKTLWDHLEDQD